MDGWMDGWMDMDEVRRWMNMLDGLIE